MHTPNDPQAETSGCGPNVRRDGYPFAFRCRRSGNCCSRPDGFVAVTAEEQVAIAAHLGMTADAFRGRFVGPGGRLKHGLGGRCVFLAESPQPTCEIHAVRPSRCRSWPFWSELVASPDALAEAARLCPGITLDDAGPSLS